MPRNGISVVQVEGPSAAALLVADEIEQLQAQRCSAGRALVLGLATGRTPIAVYDELIRRAQSGRLDLSAALAFNLDEYCGLGPGDPHSFAFWMRASIFDRIGWSATRVKIPSGLIAEGEREQHAAEYEAAIQAAGGIDLQLLGIGRNGHIGFNEPGSAKNSRTRCVRLSPSTIEDAARDFGARDRVPQFAISMGVATILDARRVRLLAFGEKKQAALERALHGEISTECPASFLREHADVRVYADAAALGLSLRRNTNQ